VKSLSGDVVLIGTIGKSEIIDRLIRERKIDVSQIEGKWESTLIQVVSHPLPGVARALVIAGSDKRGTIYGIYDLSEQIGVSPWYWWADVPIEHKDALYVKAGRWVEGEPRSNIEGSFLTMKLLRFPAGPKRSLADSITSFTRRSSSYCSA
jgi:hypothetical protein